MIDMDKILQAADEQFEAQRDEYAARLLDNAAEKIVDACALCESPIESRLLTALFMYRDPHEAVIAHTSADVLLWMKDFELAIRMGWIIRPQHQFGDHRVDFALFAGDAGQGFQWFVPFAIECDGHDFHERTKEQAAKDRARDRALMAMEVTVVRFTGSQIWRDARACAEDLEKVINAKHKERFRVWRDCQKAMERGGADA